MNITCARCRRPLKNPVWVTEGVALGTTCIKTLAGVKPVKRTRKPVQSVEQVRDERQCNLFEQVSL